jgi:hypothetical protein
VKAYFARGGLSTDGSAGFGGLEDLFVSGGLADVEVEAPAVAAAAAVPLTPDVEKVPNGIPLAAS